MLSVVPISSTQEFFSSRSWDSSAQVVVPGPKDADALRAELQQFNCDLNVITISRFVGLGLDRPIIQKTELIKILGTIWKAKAKSSSFSQFNQSFELFTELRSFSTDLSLFADLFEELDSDLRMILEIYWKTLELQEIVDEQLAYRLIGEILIEGTLIVWGFTHLNGNQIDMLKELGRNSEVLIPLAHDILASARPGDWPSWLSSEEYREKDKSLYPCQVVTFPKGRLAQILKKGEFSHYDFFIPKSQLEFGEVNEWPQNDLFYKAESDFFSEDLLAVFSLFPNEVRSADSLLKDIKEIKRKALSVSLDSRNFRLLKIVSLVEKNLLSYRELSEINEEISPFDLAIIESAVQLQLPRTSTIPLSSSFTGEIKLLTERPKNKNVALIIQGHFGPIVSFAEKYSTSMAKKLSAIGPKYGPFIELAFAKSRIESLAANSEMIIFVEEGLLEKDSSWQKVLSGLQLAPKMLDLYTKLPIGSIVAEVEKIPLNQTSATKIQTYLDCPKKYFAIYGQKLLREEKYSTELTPRELGLIEHEIIGLYWGGSKLSLSELVDQQLKQKIIESKKNISSAKFKNYREEILKLTENGISTIEDLIESRKGEHRFEVPLEGEGIKGSIDYEFRGNDYSIMADFKRSSSGIPLKSEFLNFEVIQMWVYLIHTNGPLPDVFGYLDLSSPDQSLLFSTDSLGGASFKTTVVPDIKDRVKEFEVFFDKTKEAMANDRQFLAQPRTEKVCRFCPINLICDRGHG